MKKILLIVFLLVGYNCYAQNAVITVNGTSEYIPAGYPEAQWEFSYKKTEKPNEYWIIAKVRLMEHWHIFDYDPGEDPLTIGTEIMIRTKGVTEGKKAVDGKLIEKKMKGFGVMRYYENEAAFKLLISTEQDEINAFISYQLCDNEKCLAPTDNDFILKLK